MLLKKQNAVQRYELGAEVSRPKQMASIPRTAHLAIIGESNSGKGSVIATSSGKKWRLAGKSGSLI